MCEVTDTCAEIDLVLTIPDWRMLRRYRRVLVFLSRNILAQNIPGDYRFFFEKYFGSRELRSVHDEAYLPSSG